MSSISTQGSSGPRSPDQSDVPDGIYLLVCLRFFIALVGLLVALESFIEGRVLFGTGLLLLVVAEAAILYGLLRLRPWALLITVVLVAVETLYNLFTINLLGAIIGGGIIAYLASVSDRFN